MTDTPRTSPASVPDAMSVPQVCQKVEIDVSEYSDTIRKFSTNAEIGGMSNIRSDDDRKQKLKTDQYIGQAGNAALSLYLTGSIDLYIKTRQKQDENKYRGDNGEDLIGFPVDVKTSVMRRGPDFNYHLYVRDREYHRGIIYVLGLMSESNLNVVSLVGFKSSEHLPQSIDGRREVPMSGLDEMSGIFSALRIANQHSVKKDSASAPQSYRTSVPTNEPHEVSARRGWVVLDGERLWTDGLIVVEDGRQVMRFYYGEQK